MTENANIDPTFVEALEVEDWDRVEELWLEKLEREPIPVAEMLEVRRQLWKKGKKNLARTLLELLAESLEDGEHASSALEALRELVRLAEPKPSTELLERLVTSLTAVRRESPTLTAVLAAHPILASRRPLEELEAVECWLDHDRGTVVEVVGQGVGRVSELNLELENIKVDLGGRRPVSVPFGAARRYLRALPQGDFRRRKVEDPEALAAFVEDEPGEALVEVLESLSEASDVAAIKAALDGVLPAERWTSWWAQARKHPRVLSSGSGSRLRYAVSRSAESAGETLLEELRAAPPEDRLTVARRLAERGSSQATEAAEVLKGTLAEVVHDAPGLAWQIAGGIASLPGGAAVAAEYRARLLAEAQPQELLNGTSERTARAEALEALADSRPDDWPEIWSDWMLHEQSSQLLQTIAERLEEAGKADLLDQALEAIFRNHAEHPAQFLWACEAMSAENAPDALVRRMTPSLLEKIPDALTRKEFASFRGRAKALLDGGRVAIRLLMEEANPQQAARFNQRISRIDSVEPNRVRLVEQAARHGSQQPVEREEPLLVATKSSIEAKREELRELLEVDIPRTLKGINAAAAEGDLRENFEYHMLRDRQELQSARAAKLQEELAVVRVLEPGSADTSTVNIGTVVFFEEEEGDAPAPITILGAWDADPDRRIFANGAEVAQRLLGRAPGDEVELAEQSATIARIEAWKP